MLIIVFFASLVITLMGIMFRVDHWPFGKEIQNIGLVAAAFATVIAHIVHRVKSYLKK